MSYSDFIVKDDFDRYGIQPGRRNPLTYLQVELTDKCNLRCGSCPRSVTPSSKDILSLDDFKKLLDDAPLLRHVSFVGAGEALLVEDFAEYVRLCSLREIFSSCNTNGILVEKRLPAAIEAGLGKVAISVDASEESLLKNLRSGLKLKTLRNSISTALDLTRATNTAVSAAVTLSDMNIDQFADILEFLTSCGIREVTVESIHHWGNDKSLNKFSLFHIDAQRVVQRLEEGLAVAQKNGLKLQVFDYRRLLRLDRLQFVHCPWPWDAAMVTSKGDVTPCCVNLEAAHFNRMGNIHQESIEQIWSGQTYQEFRASFSQGEQWATCVDCVYRMEFGKAEEKDNE